MPHELVSTQTAELALRSDAPPDYARPFKAKPWERANTARLFHERCESGDKRACIIEAQIRPLDENGTSYHVVLANCLTGDLMSCRALPRDVGRARFPAAPGAMHRRLSCYGAVSGLPCDAAALREECARGFPLACEDLTSSKLSPEMLEDLVVRMNELAMQGCAAGIANECHIVKDFADNPNPHATRQLLCDLDRSECDALADEYHYALNRPRERETLEIACQYGKHSWLSCLLLGEGYLHHQFEEPVPGRGQDLIDLACKELASPGLLAHQPVCRRAKKN